MDTNNTLGCTGTNELKWRGDMQRINTKSTQTFIYVGSAKGTKEGKLKKDLP